jgi:hypothetical protein
MRVLLVAALGGLTLAPQLAWAQDADLPNANLPGNSPTLPNSNLPGSLPTDNPIYLPNTDTSRAVIAPGQDLVFPEGSNVPVRNPSAPLTPEERAALPPSPQEQLSAAQREAEAAKAEAVEAREQAAEAREEAARAREEAAKLREEAARARDEEEKTPEAPPAPATPGAPSPTRSE